MGKQKDEEKQQEKEEKEQMDEIKEFLRQREWEQYQGSKTHK